MESWTTEEVGAWLMRVGLPSEVKAVFAEHAIDGRALFALGESDMKEEMALKLGHRKAILRELEELKAGITPGAAAVIAAAPVAPAPIPAVAAAAPAPVAPKPAVRALFRSTGSQARIAKGFLPVGRALTAAQLEKHRLHVYNPERKQYLPRDVPLTDEELQCWEYQASWLVCPISGQHWQDKESLMGTALYHSPRYLSDKEKRRLIEEEEAAALLRKEGREQGLDRGDEGDEWERDFDAYPAVDPPPKENLDNVGELPDDVNLGLIEVITGPAFDIRGYNWGVTGQPSRGIIRQNERGVISMDQQYNAVNFLYYLLRAENSYERKRCTNRLSFFIDEEHGARIFPSNIESQLSLLTFRDRRIMGNGSGTNQRLLATSIRKAIPRILKAVVLEVVHGRDTALAFRIDHAIRTYLLVHQVSIKLVCYYPMAYEELYRSIVQWIQNPFSAKNQATWPDLEEVMIGASLAGIPWSMVREAFVRKMISEFLVNVPRTCRREDRLHLLFVNNSELITRLMTEFSFFVSGGSLSELDRRYARCAGSLPAVEREAMKQQVLEARQVDSFIKFWLALGMDEGNPTEVVERHIDQCVRYVLGNVADWRKSEHVQVASTIRVPPLNVASWAADSALARRVRQEDQKDVAARRKEEHERQLKIHEGYPELPSTSAINSCTCYYKGCGRTFAHRGALFHHLYQFIQPKRRMIPNYHQSHHKISKPDFGKPACQAQKCNYQPTSREDLQRHYFQMKVPGVEDPDDARAASAAAAAPAPPPPPAAAAAAGAAAGAGADDLADAFENPGMCVVCVDAKRNVVLSPCGHLCSCAACAKLLKNGCPICRTPIADTIVVFYS